MLSRCTSLPGIPSTSNAADKPRVQVHRAPPVDDEAYLSILRADILRLHTLGTRRLALEKDVPDGPPLEYMIRSAEKGASGRGIAAAGLLEILVDKVMDAAIVGLKDTEGAEYKLPKHLAEGRRCLSLIDPVVALIERLRHLQSQAHPVVRRNSLRSASRKQPSPRCTTTVAATQTDEAKGPMIPPLSSNGNFDAAGFFKGLSAGSNDQHGILLKKNHISATQALVAELSAVKAQGAETNPARNPSKDKPRANPQPTPAPVLAPPRSVRAASTQTAATSVTSNAVQVKISSPRVEQNAVRKPSKESSQQTQITTHVRSTQTESAVSDQARLLRVMRVEKKRSSDKREAESEVQGSTGEDVEPEPKSVSATTCSTPTPQAIDDRSASTQPAISTADGEHGVNGASRQRNERHQGAVQSGAKSDNQLLLRCPQNHGMQWIYRKELKIALACLRCQCAINGMDGFHFCAICSHDTNQRHSICAKCSSDESIGRSYCQQVVKSASDGSLTTTGGKSRVVGVNVSAKDWAMVSSCLPPPRSQNSIKAPNSGSTSNSK
eukprot:gnl/MRDRNA2_/MRDRNA2_99694_c0_seq1.p1 gnl/MRDRNA2_/MRDRNA2_99694_c0~~gnl/MRDRNA2_/MRDRNA2_99694_c0_seq1.p1  ORF type:complete len:552 (+),score=87.54 gnl/MRDRNA2_/MRDRNA2_99694_c0_seq1:88-1743(+)